MLVQQNLEEVKKRIASIRERDGLDSAEITRRITQVVSVPGKMVRPSITLLSAMLWRETDDTRVINMATAVELLHIATLIHDDTVDKASIRRGYFTASTMWGNEVAVLLGDYVFASSAIFVCNTGIIHLVKRFAETICDLSQGELLEQIAQWDTHTGEEGYMQIIQKKTASLFQIAAESGATLANASPENVACLNRYGLKLGLAYQILDDILDYEGGGNNDIGKPVGQDLGSGVLTLPAIYAIRSDPVAKRAVTELFATRDAELTLPAVEAVIKAGGTTITRKVVHDFTNEAISAVSTLPHSIARDALVHMAHSCRDRAK